MPDSIKKEVVKQSSGIKDSIENYKKLIFGNEGGKGIQRNPNTIINYIWTALSYLRSKTNAKNSNADISTKFATEKIEEMVGKINNLIQKDWVVFKENASKIPYSLFKTIEPIKN